MTSLLRDVSLDILMNDICNCLSLGTLYFRMSYPYRYELYKRVDEPTGKEKYVILSTFPEKPSTDEVNDAFLGKTR